MKKLLSSLLLALTVLITASPVRADGESISSVTVVGATEQSGTPTPNTPIDIVSNNGVLKLNNFKGDIPSVLQRGTAQIESLVLDPKKTYTLSCFVSADFSSNSSFIFSLRKDGVGRANISGANLTAKAGTFYTRTFSGMDLVRFANSHEIQSGQLSMFQITDNSLYTDGTVETIADSANHTATVATLLGVGDYRDTQNINTGAITRNVGVKVFDGTESWTYNATYTRFYTSITGIREVDAARSFVMLSTHYLCISDTRPVSQVPNNSFYNVANETNVFFKTTDYTTVSAWKQFLAEQYAAGTPVIVLYPLATPTTESVAGQTMTTAPVNNRTGGVTGMTITTLLSSGASVVTTIATNAIKIATTAYNAARFSPVVNDLNSTVATIRDIVTNTINQTAAIASLQADKQTRPEDACPAGKKCLLVETEENGVIVPHWYPIIEDVD